MIFVIDDDPTVHTLVVSSLKDYAVRSYYTYESFCVGLAHKSPDLCICDLNISNPNKSGIDCGELVKKMHPTCPRVLFTGYPLKEVSHLETLFHFIVPRKNIMKLTDTVDMIMDNLDN